MPKLDGSWLDRKYYFIGATKLLKCSISRFLAVEVLAALWTFGSAIGIESLGIPMASTDLQRLCYSITMMPFLICVGHFACSRR